MEFGAREEIRSYYDVCSYEKALAVAAQWEAKGVPVGDWPNRIAAARRIQKEIEELKLDELGPPTVLLCDVERKCQHLARTVDGRAAIASVNEMYVRGGPIKWLTQMYPRGNPLGDGFSVERVIGRGGTCVVFEVQGSVHQDVACKMLQRSMPNARDYVDDFRNEVNVLDYLNAAGNKHVVNLVKDFKYGPGQQPCIVLAPVAQMDLAMFLDNYDRQIRLVQTPRDTTPRGADFGLDILFECMLCLASTLEGIHARGVAHRDIRPGNILITIVEGRYRRSVRDIMFADFGLAFREDGGLQPDESQMPLGDRHYAAPEVLPLYERDGRGVSGKTGDVFALGCVFYEMLETWHHHRRAYFPHLRMKTLPTVPRDGTFGQSVRDADSGFARQALDLEGPGQLVFQILFGMMLKTAPRSTAADVATALREVMASSKYRGLDYKCDQ